MGIELKSLGVTVGPKVVSWTDRDTLLYALGVGAGADDLALTTENSHDLPQKVLPTFGVIVAAGFEALPLVGRPNWGRLLHGAQEIRVCRPLVPAGSLAVTSRIGEIRDKGPGKNAVVVLLGTGADPESGETLVTTRTTLVFRGEGGFGGSPGEKPEPQPVPDREPDAQVVFATDERLPLIYRLSGDRNPLHSDPWFARERAGFPQPIIHGLCVYGIAGRALVSVLGDGDPDRLSSLSVRFTSPTFPGETLTTSVWRTDEGSAVFRTEAAGPDGSAPRAVLDEGRATCHPAQGPTS
ncbi:MULTISPECIES: MaoC family dehydratase [unclassified Pseudofrankia]|uniref:MaoC family dehydratase n=1 Tax=unclassified Pseudofrankia TaxID=2994372 RepID=UPI0008DA1A5F|nr:MULTISPECIES: MaoC family dehydratase [unclassified Pseudofrankia]MDT3445620.1 MaoC/PaaZ C-terminal domain-containing protein [Pseudofrankia sp. BMG5.37]OHV63531.1 dehydrogenase [Pseudofrankia sp. BMG5.36]